MPGHQHLQRRLVRVAGRERSRPRRRPRWRGRARCRHLLQRVEDLGADPQASAKLEAPAGTIMNSWKSTELSAWAPPLSTFIIGTGSSVGSPLAVDAAEVAVERLARSRRRRPCAAASETPRIALAPSRPLFGVPSSSISVRSIAAWSVGVGARSAVGDLAVDVGDRLADALAAPPAPPSRSSTASNSPVEAPDGTAARPRAPPSSSTSTSTVGLPRESRIWRAWTLLMLASSGSLSDWPERLLRENP